MTLIKRVGPPVIPGYRQAANHPIATQPFTGRLRKPTAIASTAVLTLRHRKPPKALSRQRPTFYIPPTSQALAGPLEYLSSPAPAFPDCVTRGITVTSAALLVGIDGPASEVTVAQSSGHRELDEAARAQVLRRWSFQPASKNGQAVQAIGMVPIEFALR